MNPTKTQVWFRSFSDRLEASFRASEKIEHKVTKGETREHQILDILQVLPSAFALERDVVIDVFNKGRRLRSLTWSDRVDQRFRPLYVVFAYECRNPSLTFFDFVTAFMLTPSHAPSFSAILNVGLIGFRDTGGRLVAKPAEGNTPVLIRTGSDTVLALLYLLCRELSAPDVAEVFRSYSESFFQAATMFYFDADFATLIGSDAAARASARSCFKGKPKAEIGELYGNARRAVGL